MPVPIVDLLQLSHSAIVELFEVDLSTIGTPTTFRFCNYLNGSNDVVWQGKTFAAYPIQVSGFEFTGKGQIPTPTMILSNTFSTITSLCDRYDDLVGAKVTRRRTLAKFLDGSPTANPNWEYAPDVFFIDRKASETKVAVTFELASSLDMEGVKIPLRIITADVCSWQFGDRNCGYTGNAAPCDNSKKGCETVWGKYAALPFGAFPGVDNQR